MGDFSIGGLRSRLLVGLDYFSQEAVNNGLGYVFIRNVSPQGDVNFIDPYTGDELAPVYLSRASIDPLLANTEVNNSKARNGAFGAYVSEVLNITPAFTILAAIRMDYFDSEAEDYDQFAWSPKFRVV